MHLYLQRGKEKLECSSEFRDEKSLFNNVVGIEKKIKIRAYKVIEVINIRGKKWTQISVTC